MPGGRSCREDRRGGGAARHWANAQNVRTVAGIQSGATVTRNREWGIQRIKLRGGFALRRAVVDPALAL